jgi:hypothetical protein
MRISPEPPWEAPTLDPSGIEIALRDLFKRLQLLEREFAFSKFTVEILSG